jgi:hypothetical protein
MSGAAVIRAYGYQTAFVRRLEGLIDRNASLFLTLQSATAWLGFSLELISASFLMITLAAIVAFRSSVQPAYAAMCMFNVLTIPHVVYMLSLNISELENKMVSFERAAALTTIVQEAPRKRHMDESAQLWSWPSEGRIEFANY